MEIVGFFRNIPIKKKLILLCVLTTASGLFLAGIVFIVNEVFSSKAVLMQELKGIADTVGKSSAGALVTHDRQGMEETLGHLNFMPHIMYAAVYDVEGRVFAHYQRGDYKPLPQAGASGEQGYHFGIRHLAIFQNIVSDEKPIGAVYMVYDLNKFYFTVFRHGVMLCAVMALSLLISYLLSSRLQKIVTEPLLELTSLMGVISKKEDYALRAVARNKDETGYLAQGFNEMLKKMQERDGELKDYRRHLEKLVEKRTEELSEINRHLQQELVKRESAERALRESEDMYRTIFENTGNASIIVEDDTTISLANTEFEKLSGYSLQDIEKKKSWIEFFDKAYAEQMKEYHYLRRINPLAAPKQYEARFVDKSGVTKDVYLTVALIPGTKKSVLSILDIDDRKDLEEQLRQSQKMEAIGQLAGGIAHDFNNILTTVIGYSGMLQMKMDPESPLKEYVESIMSSAERATHLTQGLLAFGRKQVLAPKIIDLNDTIRNVEKLLRRLIGEDIELVTAFNQSAVMIFADSGQLSQVLMNLAANARDAMPDGGILTIRTEIATLEGDPAKLYNSKPRKYALLTVSDTGSGMDKDTSRKIFEPFFTTKEVGKGTGLGLSIVYGIVRQHQGLIDVVSEPGKGTLFKIYFPLKRPSDDKRADSPVQEIRGGQETILVAEDDPHVRELTRDILEEYGYHVIEACDGEDAVAKFRQKEGEISLAVLDVIMPKKNGKMVQEEITGIRPDIKTIFMSGYTADIIHKKGVFEEGIHFIAKPIISHTLLRKVREVLDG
ncbi:MAG TPA: ATP-binding protein [Syntrophorhabdaceae bacterium]|nr:ATP-binding protein [Syntrophorhabdaceae bacterium]